MPKHHHDQSLYICLCVKHNQDYSSFFIISGLLSSVESLITSFLSAGDWLPPLLLEVPFVGLLPHPFTRICLCSCSQLLCSRQRAPITASQPVSGRTFNASFREKLFSQWPQGKGFTAKWIRLCRFRSWLRLKDWGH